MKILGAIITWQNMEFFKPSLKQALDFCDEVIVMEGSHSKQYPHYSTDGTVEYLNSLNHPKLRILIDRKDQISLRSLKNRHGRYDLVQWHVFNAINKSFKNWQSGNWIIQWDDDVFWFDEDLRKIKEVLSTTSHDRVMFRSRKFIYNFRFNTLSTGGVRFDRITEGCYYRPLANLFYKNGRSYLANVKQLDLTMFHYTCVKKPERMKARWVMSMEKGTKNSKERIEKWMGIEWDNDEDILKHRNDLAFILGNQPKDFNIYSGKHPEILDNHPWRYIEDVRKL